MILANLGLQIVLFGSKNIVWYEYYMLYSVFVYTRLIHSLQITYIAVSLYLIIVRQNNYLAKRITSFTFFANAIGLPICFIPLTIYRDSFEFPDLTKVYPSFLALVVIPSIFVLILLVILYFHIRVSLKQEASLVEFKNKRSRIFAKRLLLYPMIYFLACISYFASFIIYLKNGSLGSNYIEITELISELYPLLNSICYGLTSSSKRFIYAVCLNDTSYNDEEEVLELLRKENIMRPRFYLDLIGESDDQIFEQAD